MPAECTLPADPAMPAEPASHDEPEMRDHAGSGERIVSIIVPCRNERRHIDAFAASALAQRLPAGWRLELIVADGRSDDGTADALRTSSLADPRLRCIDNPGRIVSTGLNRALDAARGEVLVRMDVHTEYAPDYVAQCLAALERSGADNVGGAWRAEPDPGLDSASAAAAWQCAIALAFQSPAVAGGALSRRLDHEGPADTVYLGAWPRATFERFGRFDEALVRNQDDEHNLRIVKGGGRVWQSSRISSRYRPRARLAQVARQYLQYGYWKPFVMRKHGQAASLRQWVPGLFVAAVVLGAALAAFGAWRWLAGLLAAYAMAVAAMSLSAARHAEAVLGEPHPVPPGVRIGVLLRVPAVIAVYHVAYGIGSICGGWDVLTRGRGRAGFGTSSR